MTQGRSLATRFLETCVLVLAGAVLLDWAWGLLRPLLPVLVGGVVVLVLVGTIARSLMRRHEYW